MGGIIGFGTSSAFTVYKTREDICPQWSITHRSRILALCSRPVLSLQMHKAEMVMQNPVFPPPCCLVCIHHPTPHGPAIPKSLCAFQPSPNPFPAHGCFGEAAGRSQRLVLHTSPKLAMENTFVGRMRVSKPDSGTALKGWTHLDKNVITDSILPRARCVWCCSLPLW